MQSVDHIKTTLCAINKTTEGQENLSLRILKCLLKKKFTDMKRKPDLEGR